MTPLSFEWIWDIEHIIFFGLLYVVLGIVGCCVAIAAIKTVLQLFGFIKEKRS